MSSKSPTPPSGPATTGHQAAHNHSSQGQSLDQALQRAGFYPVLVADVVADALDGRDCLAHLVHLETHFDRAEVRRHITVLVLTEDMLVITHVDDQQLDEAGEQIVAQISTESVPVAQIRSVVLSYMYAQPQNYTPSDPVRELTLSIAWSGGQRLDVGPASCGDPQCEADHGYTGTISQEDIVLRISSEADGPRAVQDAKIFARALRAVNTGGSRACSTFGFHPRTASPLGRLRKPVEPRTPALMVTSEHLARETAPTASTVPGLPGAPLYGSKSIAEVFTSAAASMGLPGFENKLQLPASQRVCVVLADGLGRNLLKQKAAHTPFLRSVANSGQGAVPVWLDSAFPSTTASSLASLGTGRTPGEHGMVGYDVLDPAQDKVVNLLGNWDAGVDPLRWQPFPTIFERVAADADVVTVSLPQFGASPMTRAALRGSRFVGGTSLHARTAAAGEAMAAGTSSLMYFYVNELDKAGHRYGCQSDRWEHQLEEVDSTVKRLSSSLPAGTTILVTGDHGMLDVPESQRIDYSADPALIAGVRHTAGEPRMVHLYLEPDSGERDREALLDAWRARFGDRIWAFTREQGVAAGLFGGLRPEVSPRIGDVMIAARDTLALYDVRRVRPTAMEVVGQHGSLTKAEREVPLLCFQSGGPKGRRG